MRADVDVLWRTAAPADHAVVIAQLDPWWGGRHMADMLPRLFFDHFRDTSFVATAEDGSVVAFVVAFASPHDPDMGYIHFVGVHPDWRGRDLGRAAYARVFVALQDRGCRRVTAVTSPVNSASLAFHQALGFEASAPVADYDGPGQDRIVLTRDLTDASPHT